MHVDIGKVIFHGLNNRFEVARWEPLGWHRLNVVGNYGARDRSRSSRARLAGGAARYLRRGPRFPLTMLLPVR